MSKTRPGVERITKQQLQAEHATAIMKLSRHLKGCRQCQRAGQELYARCDTWWHLAKTEHRTARALRRYAEPDTANMDPLPGME